MVAFQFYRRVALASAAVLLTASGAWADLSGDLRVVTENQGREEIVQTGKIFIEGGANAPDRTVRMEMTTPGDPEKVVMLTIPKENTVYMLNPKEKTYLKLPVAEEQAAQAETLDPSDFKEVDRQVLSGRETIVKEASVQTEGETGATVRIWVAPELNGETVKSQVRAGDGSVSSTVIENASTKPLPDTLFQVPKGYKEAKVTIEPPGAG